MELAHTWALEHRWTLGGIRAMFSDARRHDLVETNPFTNLRLRGSRGRKDIDVLSRAEVERLVVWAVEVWAGEVAYTMQALIWMAAFVAMRPAELEMPRPLDAEELIFRASRGGPITGRVQHYYWHPVRCRFGKSSLDFYELRLLRGAASAGRGPPARSL